MKGERSKLGQVAVGLGTLATLVLLWEAGVRIFRVPTFLVPTPSAVAAKLVEKAALFPIHIRATLVETLAGFALGTVAGIAAALAIVSSRFLQSVLYPLLVMAQIVPKVAIAPLLLIWFGYGLWSKVLIAFLVAFFPVVVNTILGLRAVALEMLDLVRALRASHWQVFAKIRVPFALPFIFGGMKVAITLAVIGAIIGEFVGGNSGLGYLIMVANYEVDTALMFSALFLLSALGMLLYGVVAGLERLLIPWSVPEEPGAGRF